MSHILTITPIFAKQTLGLILSSAILDELKIVFTRPWKTRRHYDFLPSCISMFMV